MAVIPFRPALLSLSLLLLGFESGLAAASLDDPAAPLPWNAPANREVCPVGSNAVWVEYAGGHQCIRYFAAGGIDGAPVAIIRFKGDRTSYDRRDPEDIPGNTAGEQQAYAERLARKLKLPLILVERPGTYGSSGKQKERRQPSEFLALNAALDKIRQRHHLGRLVLSGHSGGATVGAALLTLGRTDIACAVLTSGAYGLLERARILRERYGWNVRPGYDTTGLPSPYDPLQHVAGVVHDPKRMIVVIGNKKDRVTPFVLQKKFAEALRSRGHRVRLINYPATPPSYHNLKDSIGLTTAARCARGVL